MNVSSEQIEAIERGEAIEITVDQTECVLIKKDVYRKIEKLIDYSEPETEETFSAIEEAWGDEGLEAYQDYK